VCVWRCSPTRCYPLLSLFPWAVAACLPSRSSADPFPGPAAQWAGHWAAAPQGGGAWASDEDVDGGHVWDDVAGVRDGEAWEGDFGGADRGAADVGGLAAREAAPLLAIRGAMDTLVRRVRVLEARCSEWTALQASARPLLQALASRLQASVAQLRAGGGGGGGVPA
jgi:hypothetical protein